LSRRSEASRAGRRSNDATLSDITTDTSLVTIVANELETVGVGGDEWKEIKVPLSLSAVVLNKSSGGNKANRKRVGASTKIPAGTSGIDVSRRIGLHSDAEDRSTSSHASNSL